RPSTSTPPRAVPRRARYARTAVPWRRGRTGLVPVVPEPEPRYRYRYQARRVEPCPYLLNAKSPRREAGRGLSSYGGNQTFFSQTGPIPFAIDFGLVSSRAQTQHVPNRSPNSAHWSRVIRWSGVIPYFMIIPRSNSNHTAASA